jgi:hypothetical protein
MASSLREEWLGFVPRLSHFAQAADPSNYAPIPDEWWIGVSDVVDSTSAIDDGRYRAVNLAGAATISAVANALGGALELFAFGGDGAGFAVRASEAPTAADALSRVAKWAQRDLNLDLRVGMTSVADVRAAGFDARVAYWQASENVRYAMFSGGGMKWAEAQLKNGAIALPLAAENDEPDLTGLSCQWGPIQSKHGKIVSLIVKRAPGASEARFSDVVSEVVTALGESASINPVPAGGPDVRWPTNAIGLQSRVALKGRPTWPRYLHVLVNTALIWLVFKLGLNLGRFNADRYRREIAVNTDYRKFDDALMMTVDCSPDVARRLRAMLDAAASDGAVRYGLHTQDEAIMTCVVPSVLSSDHMHFVDGAGGGYAFAAQQLNQRQEHALKTAAPAE